MVEEAITKILRKNFSFRFIALEDSTKAERRKKLEKALIGTAARCRLCKPSDQWLGRCSPRQKIRESGLWLEQHLNANSLTEEYEKIMNAIKIAIERYPHPDR